MPIDGFSPPESRTADLVGSVLGKRYRLISLIGRGGMASVFRAVDELLPRAVAVKLMAPNSTDGEVMSRQRNEIDALASLNHHALVTLYDAGTDWTPSGERAFLVMELVDGPNLRELLTSPLPPMQVAHIGADIAEGLHYMHEHGFIHRDIKPANILLGHSDLPDRTFHAKLADFGIARLVDDNRLTSTGIVIGTANYLSPEQASGKVVSAATDVYSLGLVLLEALTGKQAFPGTSLETVGARLVSQPVIPSGYGSVWGDLLNRMTAIDPAQRPLPLEVALTARELARTTTGVNGAEETIASHVPATVPASVTPPTPTSVTPPTVAGETRVFPAVSTERVGNDDSPTGPVAAGPRTAERTRPRPRPRSVIVFLSALAVVIAATVGTIAFSTASAPDSTTQPYPSVSGTLGTHLKQLQDSVGR